MDKEKFHKITAALYQFSAADFKDKLLDEVTIEDLLDLIFNSKDEKAEFRAAWALEHILLNNDALLKQYNTQILEIYKETKNWSSIRSTTKILMKLLKTPLEYNFLTNDENNEKLLNKTFQLLENSNCPIAVRCNAYDICYLIGVNEKWVLSELKTQILFDLEKSPSPALTSRAKRLLKKLEGNS